jgi:hypothetical protein
MPRIRVRNTFPFLVDDVFDASTSIEEHTERVMELYTLV